MDEMMLKAECENLYQKHIKEDEASKLDVSYILQVYEMRMKDLKQIVSDELFAGWMSDIDEKDISTNYHIDPNDQPISSN
jgi:hypothetical protein